MTERAVRERVLTETPLRAIDALHQSATATLITPACSSWLIEGRDEAGRPLQAQLSEDELLYYYYRPAGLTKEEAATTAKAAGWSLPEGGPTMVLPYASGFHAYWLAGENRFIDPVSGELISAPPLALKEGIERAKAESPLRTTQEREVWDLSQNLLLVGGWDEAKRPLAVWVGAEGVKAWTYLDQGISSTDAERRSLPYNFQWLGQSILEEPENPVWSMRAITAEGELVEFQVDLKGEAERVLHLSPP